MKKTWIAGALLALLVSGCTEVKLDNGCYIRNDRNDGSFVCVHDDLIFLRVRMPENSPHGESSYDWAGKYKIDSDNDVILDMDREELRNWNFYFNLRKNGKNITVEDFSRNQRFQWVHESASGSDRVRPVNR